MHPIRKQRLWTVILIIITSSVAVGLTLFTLGENLNHFYPPSKLTGSDAPFDRLIRAGGCVVPGSVERSKVNLDVSFVVTDGMEELNVVYSGILPDLFSEGEAAVLTGKLNQQRTFVASKVLAKHDETYTPSEVADTVTTDQPEGQEHMAVCEALKYDS